MRRIILFLALLPSFAYAQAVKQNEAQATIYPTSQQAGSQASVDRYANQFVNIQYAPHTADWSQCSSAETGTSARAVKNAAGSGIRIYVSSISCSNTAAVASIISFHDGSTTLYGGAVPSNASGGIGKYEVALPTALRTAANSPINFQMTTTATSTICCMSGFTAPY